MYVVFEAGWSTYEEYGEILIYEDEEGNFYSQHNGHSVFSEFGESDKGELIKISIEEALELIDEWEEYLDEEEYVKN